MKKGWIICSAILVLAVAVCVLLALPQPGNTPEPPAPTTTTTTTTAPTELVDAPAQLRFTGKVLEVTADSVLMECYDKDAFDTVWVYVDAVDVSPQVGEEYTVTYEDMMMPSLPPRITAVTMEKN